LRLANVQRVWGVENLFQTTEHESCCKRDTFGTGIFVRVSVAGWPLLAEPSSVMLAVFVSGLIGVLFGWYPAIRAAKLDPIDALRHT
jgi:putative ABC transport system permease protein